MPQDTKMLVIFKQLFHGERPATFQLFDKRTNTSRIAHLKLTGAILDTLCNANRTGSNIAMMINQGDGKGRTAENVTGVTAVFIDTDGACTLEKVLASLVPPHLVVESSPGKFHAYWLIDGLPLGLFRNVQKQLAQRYGTDESVCDLPRVMRVPGMRNWKYRSSTYATIIHHDQEATPIPWRDFFIRMDLVAPTRKPSSPATRTADAGSNNAERVRAALPSISADPYRNWFDVGAAIHSEWSDQTGFAMWTEWSRRSAKFDADVQQATWERFSAGKGITLGTLFWMAKKYGHAGTASAEACQPRTELEVSEMFAHTFEMELRFVDGTWHGWNSHRWEADTQAADRRARDFVKRFTTVPGKGDGSSSAERLQTRSGLNNLVELAKGDARLRSAKSAFDAKPNLLAVTNGVIDLKTQRFRPGEPEDMLSRSANVSYDADATCPNWDAFVQQIADGDNVLARFLQTIVGYALFGHANEQTLFVLIGSGANGKSLFLNTTRILLGDYALAIQNSLLQGSRGNANSASPALAKIEGRRMLACSEMPKGRAFDEALVKQLSGNDAVSARGLYSDQVEFTPVAKLFLAVNTFPEVRFDDDAMWRRIVTIPFRRSFQGDQADPALGDRLLGELPGILNWALRGVRDYVAFGLWKCPACDKQKAQLRNSVDSVKAWLDAQCRIGSNLSTTAKSAYTAYSDFMRQQQRKPLSQVEFKGTLERRGFKWKKERQHNTYYGFCMK
ncbi:phage/plasmid primase, P4 family [Burkholderia semiarida]|uniref:phage/plasmid primase, P4 family n=1 Tax=Burkholderia TaxID=32008 RepID=UPI00265F3A5A|nr:phage/plasmid primase, P4 family [Burkholderia sp. AU44665]MDN7701325.1 phage/plasmid primase, P4 family [Burkholderia sp. AU44665]